MVIEVPTFEFGQAIGIWLLIMLASAVVGLLVGLAAAWASYGFGNGTRHAMATVQRGFRDLFLLSPQRIGSIAILTFKESQRRKAFGIFFLFVLLFMFGGWFLGGSDSDVPAKPYISFVLTSMNFLLILMALLVACWGLPQDIKARSLHTVVTKPVRRSEIVMGRMLGYIGVLTLVLVCTSVVGYFWILLKVPDRAQDQLIARVPKYGTVEFRDRLGNPADEGINVGDVWEYRSFIEGGTQARAIWTFRNLDVASLRREEDLKFEQTFEAFRTFKGDVNQQLRYSMTLINPETGLRVPIGTHSVEEFSQGVEDSVVRVPQELVYTDSYDINAVEQEVNLYDDLVHNGTLQVEIAAIDSQQYIGMSPFDLFIRMPDRTFLSSYSKACFGLWLMLVLVSVIGTTASCFLKGPVATIFTASLIFVGFVFKTRLRETLTEVAEKGSIQGGGVLESMYRLLTQDNLVVPMPDNVGTQIIKGIDRGIFELFRVVQAIIPDMQYFSTAEYPANGFDVSFYGALLPSLFITIGFTIPMIILGYFSLQLRELESK